MRSRGYTILEIMVVSGVMLVMLVMTTGSLLSYMRSYRLYQRQALELRQLSKTLEAVCRELRGARNLKRPIPSALRQGSLDFEDELGPATLSMSGDRVTITRGGQSSSLGQATNLELQLDRRLLVVRVAVGSQLPLQTAVVVRRL